jgi:tetratricopeptide (TPR) repeat protein
VTKKPKLKAQPKPVPRRRDFPAWLPPTVLLFLTVAIWARSLAVPIQNWDDDVYLFRDARLHPLSWDNIGRILTQPFFANFHPLTTLTYAFDRAVWKTWVPGFHITQLALYAGGVLGVYLFFTHILRRTIPAFAAAAIYAVHTIHVESVAWLASRKDVTCLLFYAFALLTYARYADEPRWKWRSFVLVAALSAAAMFSKGYAVVLPLAFLAYDFCFLERIGRRQILDKIPLLAIALLASILTVHAQDRDTTLIQSTLTGERRFALLAKVLALYVGHALVPIHLTPFYTIAREPAGSMAGLGVLLALALVAMFFLARRRMPAVSFGIALFLLPLGTVMNVFFTLRIWMADRYLFFPTIGSSLALVGLGMALLPARGKSRSRDSAGGDVRSLGRWLATAAALVIVTYSAMTLARIGIWANRVELWSDTARKELHLGGSGALSAGELAVVTNLRSTPSTPLVNLIAAYQSAGQDSEAAKISGLLGASGTGDLEGQMELARKDLQGGHPEAAIQRLKPISEGRTWMAPPATIWMGIAQSNMGDTAASRQSMARGIALYRKTGQPATDAFFSIGGMEFNKGNYVEAANWYRRATQESPGEAKSAFYLGRALEMCGKPEEAMAIYKRIVGGELPIVTGTEFTLADVYLQMGIVAEKQNQPREAIGYLEEALRLAPNHPQRQAILASLTTLRGKAGGSGP